MRLATVLICCVLLGSCKGGNDNGPDVPTGPSGPAPAVTNPVIHRFNVPSGGFLEVWVTNMRPAKNGVLSESYEYYTQYRNTSSEVIYRSMDFVAEEGHDRPEQNIAGGTSFGFYQPNTASSPSSLSGNFDTLRNQPDLTYWRMRVWVLLPGENTSSRPDRLRAPDGVFYERFGWRR